MSRQTNRRALVLVAAITVSMSGGTADAQNATPSAPPDAVKLPAGINLGGSSFYDAFGGVNPGWTIQNYDRLEDLTSIRDASGQNSPLFINPHIYTLTNIIQVVYVPPVSVPGGGVQLTVLFPIVDFQSHFDQPGVSLHNNGLDIGDLTFGAAYQAEPLMKGNRPILSWRAELDVIAPIGGFDSTRDINQSSGFWSLNPYISATILPLPDWEISARFYYLYNLPTSRAANPPSVPEFIFRNGQAGQAGWINFTSSYAVTDGVRPGINGFWLQQFTNDITNGVSVPHTRAAMLYLGPGLSWAPSRHDTINFNIYLPVSAANVAAGPQFNVQWIHPF